MSGEGELLYRLLLAVLYVVFLLVWLHAARRSGLSRQFFYRSTEGPLTAGLIRLSLLLGNGCVLLYCFTPQWLGFAQLPLVDGVRWMGGLLALLGTFLIRRVFQHLGRHFSTSLDLKANHQLIVTGPYRWVRHPMYVAYFLCWLGWSMVASNLCMLIIGLSGLAVVAWVRTPKEEAMMREQFGESYTHYCKNTPRYLPKRYR